MVAFASPLFIVGYPRSGTTLLQAVLGSHSEVSLSQDPRLLHGLIAAGLGPHDSVTLADRTRVLLEMSKIKICRRHLAGLPGEVVVRFLTEPGELSFGDAYELLLPRDEQTAVWGEKGVSTVFYLEQLAGLYPRAAFVHILRDPRAAILSHYRKRMAGARAVEPPLEPKAIRFVAGGALRWRAWLLALRRSRVAADRVVEVRYEDLVRGPEEEIRRLCATIGLSFEPRMVERASWAADSGVSIEGSRAEAHRKLTEEIDPTRAEAAAGLPPWARQIIERELESELREVGYLDEQDGPDAAVEAVDAELRRARPALERALRRELAWRLGCPESDPAVADLVAPSLPPGVPA